MTTNQIMHRLDKIELQLGRIEAAVARANFPFIHIPEWRVENLPTVESEVARLRAELEREANCPDYTAPDIPAELQAEVARIRAEIEAEAENSNQETNPWPTLALDQVSPRRTHRNKSKTRKTRKSK